MSQSQLNASINEKLFLLDPACFSRVKTNDDIIQIRRGLYDLFGVTKGKVYHSIRICIEVINMLLQPVAKDNKFIREATRFQSIVLCVERLAIQYLLNTSSDTKAVIAFAEQVDRGGLPPWVNKKQKDAVHQMRVTHTSNEPRTQNNNTYNNRKNGSSGKRPTARQE